MNGPTSTKLHWKYLIKRLLPWTHVRRDRWSWFPQLEVPCSDPGDHRWHLQPWAFRHVWQFHLHWYHTAGMPRTVYRFDCREWVRIKIGWIARKKIKNRNTITLSNTLGWWYLAVFLWRNPQLTRNCDISIIRNYPCRCMVSVLLPDKWPKTFTYSHWLSSGWYTVKCYWCTRVN